MSYVESITLSNGLKVVYAPHKVGSVTCCLRGLAGSNYEKDNEIGAAHVLEHLCTFGSEKYQNTTDLRDIVLKNGGRITGTTSRDDVAFLTKTLKENYEDGIKYLFEIFSRPLLTQENLIKTKKIIKHEIYQNIESPKRHIGRISYKILFPNQRFSIFNTGRVEDIDQLKLQDVKGFRNKFYTPSNFVLSVCGDLDRNKLFQIVNQYFGGLPGPKADTNLKHAPNYKKSILVENRSNLKQAHLKIDYHGYKTSQKQKYSAYLLSKLLENTLKKSLKNNINPYILNCSSFNSNSYGLFGIYTALEPQKIESFLKTYNSVICKLKKEKVNRSKLDYLKNKTKADFEFNLEKTSLRADFYSELFLYKNLTDNHNQEISNFVSCTSESIKKTALEIFRQEPKITLLDKSVTKKSLENIIFS